ncbi:hypothetical protein FH972_023494 [Carpinus fangiana]|uniref:Nuclear protein DGCR14 n=1 Tax=Carpinus fangiana TaxID=176857 RepID=A0A5N6KVL0_9ROSI|nr:hypothetical protein FH972_023494 [Carpinus fangiana]
MANRSTALAKRPLADVATLMPPPPAPKRIRRPAKVLDEDTYTSALSYIIARDFFPGLLETEAQQDFLDALSAGDDEWIDQAGKRVKEAMTPRRRGSILTKRHTSTAGGMTPVGWQGNTPRPGDLTASTPVPTRSSTVPPMPLEDATNEEKPDLSLSLAAFQARYTSEDNESFNRVLDRHNAKHNDKHAWLWQGNKMPSARQIAQAARQQRQLTASEVQLEHDRARLGSSHIEDHSMALALRTSNDQDTRPTSISKVHQEPRNALMFPKGQEDITATHPTFQTAAEAAAERSNAPPKSIAFGNTRLPLPPPSELSNSDGTPESPTLSAIDAAITGNLDPNRYATSTTLSGSETPRVNGYAFVDEEPTAAELRAAEMPQTQQSKEKDRFAILSSIIEANRGSGTSPFSIATQPRREALHHRIVEKTLSQQRQKTARTRAPSNEAGTPGRLTPSTGRTPTPRFMSSPRVVKGADGRLTAAAGLTPGRSSGRKNQGSLTPAARMLYNKVGRTPSRAMSGVGEAFSGSSDAEKRRTGGAFTPTALKGVKKAG